MLFRSLSLSILVNVCTFRSNMGRPQRGLPRAFSSPSSKSPVPSTFLHSRGAPRAPCPSCTGDPRPGCSTPDGDSKELSRGAQSPPSPCWPLLFLCSPEHSFYLWLFPVTFSLLFHHIGRLKRPATLNTLLWKK